MRIIALVTLFLVCGAPAAFSQQPELVSKREGHILEITHVRLSPDGRQALSAGADKRVVLWDLDSEKFVRLIELDTTVHDLNFLADGQSAALLLNNGELAVWNLADGRQSWSVKVAGADISGIDFSPDRERIVVGTVAGDIGVWSLEDGRRLWVERIQPMPTFVHFSVDGAQVVARSAKGEALAIQTTLDGKKLIIPDQQLTARTPLIARNAEAWGDGAFDFRKGYQLKARLPWPAPDVQDILFFDQGRKVAIAYGVATGYWSVTPDLPINREGSGAISIWDVAKGEEIAVFEGHEERVNALDLSADGSLLISASSDRTIRLWDMQSGQQRALLRRVSDIETHFHFSPNYRHLALTNLEGAFRTWRLDRREELKLYTPTVADGQEPAPDYVDINAFRFTPDGQGLLTGGRGKEIQLWEADLKAGPRRFRDRHQNTWVVTSLAVSPDGRKLLVGSTPESRVLMVWIGNVAKSDIQRFITNEKRDTIGVLTGVGPVYGQPYHDPTYGDDPSQYYFLPNFYNLSVWDMEKGVSERVFPNEEQGWGEEPTVRFSPDGRLALAGHDGRWSGVDLSSNRRIASDKDSIYFQAISYEPDGAYALTIEAAGAVTKWKVEGGGTVGRFNGFGKVVALGAHPDGGKALALSTDGRLSEWDTRTGNVLRQMPLSATGATELQYSPNGRYASARGQGGLWVVDLQAGKLVLELGTKGTPKCEGDQFLHLNQPWHVSLFDWLPDGRTAVSATLDGAIRFWNLEDGSERATLTFPGGRDWVVTTPSGLFDASPGAMQRMYYAVGTSVVELEQLKERYFEPGLLQRLLGWENGELRDVEGFAAVKLYPLIDAEIVKDSLRIQLTERNGGLGKLSLFVNGKEVSEDINPGRRATLRVDLRAYDRYYLPDSLNFIELRAYNAEGWLKSQAYRLDYPLLTAKGSNSGTTSLRPLGASKPSLHALVVGTAQYAGDRLDLKYTDLDAAAMAQALSLSGKALFEDRVSVRLLSTAGDQAATGAATGVQKGISSKATVEAAFKALAAEAKAGDVVIVYFSGHGVTYGAAEKSQFYYLTKDIANDQFSDPEILNKYAISSGELTRWLNTIPALKQVMIIDACNSGKVVEDMAAAGAKELNASQIRALDRLKDRTGMFILTGSAADKVSYEAGRYGQSLLTYSLLLGMSGLALTPDKQVDVMGLFQYARNEVPDLAKGIGGIQTPVLAFPTGGASFPIGIVNPGMKIPVAQVKPVFIRNNFQEEENFADLLDLTGALEDYLLGITAKGAQASIIYVDVKAYENAYSIKGRYTVNGEDVNVRGRLFKGQTPVGELFKVRGKRSELSTLVEEIVTEVSGMVE